MARRIIIEKKIHNQGLTPMRHMNKDKKIKVLKLFPISDRRWIIAHLESFKWDFKIFGPVLLCLDNVEIHMRQIGFGNHEGTAAVTLEPYDDIHKTVDDIMHIYDQSAEICIAKGAKGQPLT